MKGRCSVNDMFIILYKSEARSNSVVEKVTAQVFDDRTLYALHTPARTSHLISIPVGATNMANSIMAPPMSKKYAQYQRGKSLLIMRDLLIIPGTSWYYPFPITATFPPAQRDANHTISLTKNIPIVNIGKANRNGWNEPSPYPLEDVPACSFHTRAGTILWTILFFGALGTVDCVHRIPQLGTHS